MIIIVLTLTAVLAVVVGIFLLGFQVGGRFWQSEVQRTRFAAARAERQMHDMTRDAFVAMTEHAERRDGDR
jgi:hypothetical protein